MRTRDYFAVISVEINHKVQKLVFPFKFVLFCFPTAVNAVYNLYAVSNHSGTTMGGHYTAYCRNPNSGEWYTFNDSRYVAPNWSNVYL